MLRTYLGAILATIALYAGCLAALSVCIHYGLYAHPTTTTAIVGNSNGVCDEDEPCWQCASMGNHQCGPVIQ